MIRTPIEPVRMYALAVDIAGRVFYRKRGRVTQRGQRRMTIVDLRV
jgi:hypothetical protein